MLQELTQTLNRTRSTLPRQNSLPGGKAVDRNDDEKLEEKVEDNVVDKEKLRVDAVACVRQFVQVTFLEFSLLHVQADHSLSLSMPSVVVVVVVDVTVS